MSFGFSHEAAEKFALFRELREELGVPLHTDEERGGLVLDALDDAVAVLGGCDELVAEAVDSLLVQRVDAARATAK
jgi:hypothetical protein